MRTIFVNEREAVRAWHLIDAAGRPLGSVAARVACLLRGKHKASYTPNQEMGDYVVVINAEKVFLSGTKPKDKMYYRHSGYPGGLKSVSFSALVKRRPVEPLRHAVKGMLPKGPLGRKLIKNVKIYAGSVHPHESQNPVPLSC